MDEIRSKEAIVLDLKDIRKAALMGKAISSEIRLEILKCLVTKAMTISELASAFYLPMSSMCLHIKTLKEAGLITVSPRPGIHGSQKLCGINAASISLDVFAHTSGQNRKPPALINMPVGHYSNCEIHPPCGIVTANQYLSQEDSPHGFYSTSRTDAALLWFSWGFLEYQFPNSALQQGKVSQVEFSFEVCSEAPGYNNNWPSDITIAINGRHITTFITKGDYGGRKGIYNPSWWSDSVTQFGEYKKLLINDKGCFLDNVRVSDETMESLGLAEGYYFTFMLKVDKDSEHVGGMNLFGSRFGDYAQDIVMSVEYEGG
ncbi:MAG: helix-turn-helix domain-containing protein [Eubacteriales bacterium]|nr:helix-turn-helix domain-containing protein [Eubacteriales bacterium]